MEKVLQEELKKSDFTLEEIDSIERGIQDVDSGKILTEDEFYANVSKRIFITNREYV